MRGAASFLVIGGSVTALAAGVWATNAQSARVTPHPAVQMSAVPENGVQPKGETDAERRARLNARMQDMLRDGRGARLTQTSSQTSFQNSSQTTSRQTVSRPAPQVRSDGAPATARRASAAAEQRPARSEPASTIAPPAYDASRARPASSGRGYTPPRLDLKTAPVVPDNDLECLTQAIYYEARNESEEGQAAVAEVVINRSRHGGYPRKICEVVYQRNSRTCQFTFTCDGSIGRRPVNMVSWARAERIAREVYHGEGKTLLPTNSVNYHANYVRPSWGQRLARVRQIGAHIFYGGARDGGLTPGAERTAVAERVARSLFVRNEALDRAYEAFSGGADRAKTDAA